MIKPSLIILLSQHTIMTKKTKWDGLDQTTNPVIIYLQNKDEGAPNVKE